MKYHSAKTSSTGSLWITNSYYWIPGSHRSQGLQTKKQTNKQKQKQKQQQQKKQTATDVATDVEVYQCIICTIVVCPWARYLAFKLGSSSMI